jgi:hypothetical protein
MNIREKTFYCMAWEKRSVVRNLRKTGYTIISIEYVTKGKVVIVASERFRW